MKISNHDARPRTGAKTLGNTRFLAGLDCLVGRDWEPQRGGQWKAQGNALGNEFEKREALKGRNSEVGCRPFRAKGALGCESQGVALGYRPSPLRGCQPRNDRITGNAGKPGTARDREGEFRRACGSVSAFFCAFLCLFAALSSGALAAAPKAPDRATVIVVVGAAGETEFGDEFAKDAARWATAGATTGANLLTLGLATADTTTDREKLQAALAAEPKEGVGELWLVLIGHGTFDGKEAKFNLRGPDLAASDLAEWLKPFRRPLALIDTASASAPFLVKLTGP
ncbi:MAG: hypothetical protein RLZZ15_4136, partial [Verrucomicrobiota bacterium]